MDMQIVLTNKARRQADKARRQANAGLLAHLYRDLMVLVAKDLNLRSVLRLLQTCRHLHLDKTLRQIVANAKPGMVKAIKAKTRQRRKRGPLGKGKA